MCYNMVKEIVNFLEEEEEEKNEEEEGKLPEE